MKPRAQILWWPIAVAAVVLAAFLYGVWVLTPTNLPVSQGWTVTELQIPFALPQPDNLLTSEAPGKLTFAAGGVWTHDTRTGETFRLAPPERDTERYDC